MKKKDKILILIIGILIIVPIVYNEIKEYNLRTLKEEVLNISKALENSSNSLVKVPLKDKIVLDGKEYNLRGSGYGYKDKDTTTVIVSYRGYCAIKYSFLEEVALAKTACPQLEVLNNVLIPIVDKNGLVKEKNGYLYKGEADNYLSIDNDLWRILSFEDGKIKIVKDTPIASLNKNEYTTYLNNNFSFDKSLFSETNFDISNIELNKKIVMLNTNSVKNYVGILSLNDYLNSLNEECKIKNNSLMCSTSFLSKSMWLSDYNVNSSYYVYNDGNVYLDKSSEKKDVYPVLVLKEDTEIISGDGTLEDPYKIS